MHHGKFGRKSRMKLVIMAGGLGTRIGEESKKKPKPMVEVGGRPILWHIMTWYSQFGIQEFIICCGYKGHMIKQYFLEYNRNNFNICADLKKNEIISLTDKREPWKITLINTGRNTLTAGRLLQIEKYLDEEEFLLTYGDGVGDVNIKELIEFHKLQKK